MTQAYEFRVEGQLDGHWSDALGGLEVRHPGDGTSTLTAPVTDQAQLHGVLAGLRDVGAMLLSVSTLPTSSPVAELSWPKHTARLTIRPARPEDAEPTWRFRRLEPVARWVTDGPQDLESYRASFCQPARLDAALVV